MRMMHHSLNLYFCSQWNVPRLKSLAMAAIESRLSTENILPELFSPFTPLFVLISPPI